MTEKIECAQSREWMDEALVGDLAAQHRAQLDAHLGSCPECAALWQEYQTLRRGLDRWAESEGPSLRVQNAVLRAAEAKAERQVARAGLWAWLLRPATVAFATLLLIAGIGYLSREELQKREQGAHQAPVLAPQGGGAGMAPREAKPIQPGAGTMDGLAPAKTAPAPGAAKPDSLAPAAAKPEIRAPAAEKPIPKPASVPNSDEADRARRAAPPPPPAADQAQQPAPAGLQKSLSQPPAPVLEEKAKASFSSPVIPEAEFGAGGKKDGASEPVKSSEKAKKSVPATAEGAAATTAAPPLEREVSAEQAKEPDPAARVQTLLQAAKAKLSKKDYAGALEDLLAAQRLKDSKEIQDLILLCRSHLRGDG